MAGKYLCGRCGVRVCVSVCVFGVSCGCVFDCTHTVEVYTNFDLNVTVIGCRHLWTGYYDFNKQINCVDALIFIW